MYDDSMDNVFMKYMDDLVKRQDARIKELLQDRTDMAAVISRLEDEKVALKEDKAGIARYVAVQGNIIDKLHEEIENAQELLDEMLRTMDTMETGSDKLVAELNDDIEILKRYVDYQYDLVDDLYEELDEKNTTIMAMVVQSAESEDRADEEKRKRLQLLMRI